MDEAEDCTGCVKEFIGGNRPAKNTLTATMQDGMPYVLPPWRVNEIILLVIETLSEREYYKEDFDYKKIKDYPYVQELYALFHALLRSK